MTQPVSGSLSQCLVPLVLGLVLMLGGFFCAIGIFLFRGPLRQGIASVVALVAGAILFYYGASQL